MHTLPSQSIAALFTFMLLALPISHAALQTHECPENLDTAVSLYNSGRVDAAVLQLEKLHNSCAEMPQLHHNLGVIETKRRNWTAAINHFEQAIAFDTRTAQTLSHLQAVNQYKATLAYRQALDIKGTPKLPDMQMQSSAVINAMTVSDELSDLHTNATVEYELYSWWHAAADGQLEPWLEHYVAGYPPVENGDAQVVNWDSVNRDISFASQDAVVILKYTLAEQTKQTILFLTLEQERWKIYREVLL
jgi:tetratricopeptide (TPR) repeat protein